MPLKTKLYFTDHSIDRSTLENLKLTDKMVENFERKDQANAISIARTFLLVFDPAVHLKQGTTKTFNRETQKWDKDTAAQLRHAFYSFETAYKHRYRELKNYVDHVVFLTRKKYNFRPDQIKKLYEERNQKSFDEFPNSCQINILKEKLKVMKGYLDYTWSERNLNTIMRMLANEYLEALVLQPAEKKLYKINLESLPDAIFHFSSNDYV